MRHSILAGNDCGGEKSVYIDAEAGGICELHTAFTVGELRAAPPTVLCSVPLKHNIHENRKFCGFRFHSYLCWCRTGMVIIMEQNYTIFLGDVALDEYYQTDRWPGRAEKIDTKILPPQMGGMIANAASVYASYGDKTFFSGILNPRDRKLCEQLEQSGIQTHLVVYDPSVADSKCMIFLAEGEHTVFIIDTEVTSMPITDEIQQAYCGASVIYSGLWALKYLRLGEMQAPELVAQWAKHGVKLMIDSDVDKLTADDQAFLPYVHTLFMNEVGFSHQKDGRSDEETVEWLLSFGLRMLVVTLAEKGCVIYQPGEAPLRIDGVPADVVDVTGAGDTFCSSLVWAYSRSADVRLSAEFATYASSRAVTKLGARAGAAGSEAVFQYMREKGRDPKPFAHILHGRS